MMAKKKTNWVSASDAGSAASCGHYLELKHRGAPVSQKAKVARKRGDDAHDDLNKAAEDKRCYVASYLYGVDNPNTIALRAYRDAYLSSHIIGKIFIYTYYALSPGLVTVSRRVKPVDRILKAVVERVLAYIKEKE